ncbi:unnamed protein product [Absidia cylindrospora]
MILTFGGLVPDAQKYAPPEIKQSSWTAVKDLPVAAVDSYQLGCLIYESYNRRFDNADQLIHQTGSIPMSMVPIYKSLLQPSPRSRADADSFLDEGMRSKRNGFFSVDFIHVNLFLENISIKDQGEKEAFFRKLDTAVGQFPNEFAMYKILPELVNAFEFGSGGAKALNAIMKIGEHLPDDEFDKVLVTPILRMFASPDRAIRVSLLENMPKFIDHIPDKVICAQIYPHVATGFTDTVPIIREQTIKAVLLLVPKLSERIINYDLLKYLAKLQMDQEPGIRTNTTICLGKMAKNLNEATRKKVLLPAFTRSLRDGFHHARIAALMALNATSDYYEPEECAQRVVPSIACVLLDKEKTVRTQAFKTMSSFMKRLEEEADGMPETALEPLPTITAKDNTSPSTDSPTSSNPSTPGVSMFGGATKGLTDWAVSSITRFGTPNGEMEPQMLVTADPKSSNTSRAGSIALSDRLAPEDTASFDGWGNDDETQGDDLLNLNDGWEPFDSGPQEPIKAEPITSIIPSNNHASSVSSFGSTINTSPHRPSSPPSNMNHKSHQRGAMKLGHNQPSSLAQSLDVDDSYTPPSAVSKPPSSSGTTNPDRKAELEKKREERRQRMAELREKKKTGIGAKKL